MSVTFKISDIYSQADAWEAPNADYVAINASLGPDSALNRTQAATGIANLSSRVLPSSSLSSCRLILIASTLGTP